MSGGCMKTHRETYPEQYSHPLVGVRVRLRTGALTGTVTRVVSSRFGQLAEIDGNSETFYRVTDCVKETA